MKIKNVAIKNFRGYSDEINSDFEDLTAFVGKNDIGKSTILEALDIFFNDGKGVTKLDKADLNSDLNRDCLSEDLKHSTFQYWLCHANEGPSCGWALR